MATVPTIDEGVLPAGSDLDGWVAAVRAGEREAYRHVITVCEAKVRVLLAAVLPDSGAVDDLAQEVFVTAYAKLHEYQTGTDFCAWLKAIARNLALNERRRWFRQARFRKRFEAELESAVDPWLPGVADADGVLDALHECLRQLEGAARQVTEEFYFNGRSSSQIAAATGRKDGWVRLTLFRARAALAACLERRVS